MRLPIRYQILLPFAGLMVAGLFGLTLLDAQLAAGRSERQTAEQLRAIARTLQEANFPLTERTLRQMRGLSGAEYAIVAADGRIVAASGALPELPPVVAADDWRLLELTTPLEIGQERYFLAALTLPPGRSRVEARTLQILYPEASMARLRREAALPHLLVGAATLAVAALLAFLIAGRISRPVLQVSRQVARVAEGSFSPLPCPARDDEIRDLVVSVNSLGGQLDELRGAVRRGERLSLLGRLSGGMAHTLRNQVTGARLAAQLHQRHCQADAESLEVVLRQLELTEEHLRRFLAAGRPESPNVTACDLSALAADLLALIEPACRHRNVALELRPPPALPRLLADAGQLRQCLMNLVLNASEAVGLGGSVRLELAADEPARKVVIRVFDNGPGPPAEVADRLFEPFVTSKPEGVGLGLVVARQIAEAHGGTLGFHRLNGQTCFELRLPAEV
ncbi:MAG: ATP-binding protein [Pirellulales bacterium]